MASLAEWKTEMILQYVSILDTVCLCCLQYIQKETGYIKTVTLLWDQGERQANHMHLEFIKVQKDSGILVRSKRRTKISIEQFPPSIWGRDIDTGFYEVWKNKKKEREKCGIVTREQSFWSDWPTDQNVINNEVEWLNNLLIVFYIYQILSPWSPH